MRARRLCQWHNLTEQRAGRPRHVVTLYSNPQWRPARRGVRSARKTGRWPVFSENGPAGPGATLNFCGAGLTCGTKILSLQLCRLGLRGPEEQAGGLFLPSNGPADPGSNLSVSRSKGKSHARQANPLGGFRRGDEVPHAFPVHGVNRDESPPIPCNPA